MNISVLNGEVRFTHDGTKPTKKNGHWLGDHGSWWAVDENLFNKLTFVRVKGKPVVIISVCVDPK